MIDGRKVCLMTLNELLAAVAESNPGDWSYIERPIFAQDVQQVSGSGHPVPWIEVQEHDDMMVLRSDLRISIATGLPHLEDYFEDWAREFPDERARSDFIDFRFHGVPVFRTVRVLVDGARAGLPVPPKPGTRDIPDLQYRVFSVIDAVAGSGQMDRYFDMAKFRIVDEPWPLSRSPLGT